MKWKGINRYNEYSIDLICHKNHVAGSTVNSERNALRLMRIYKARRDNKGLHTEYALLSQFVEFDKKKKRNVYKVIRQIDFN